MCPAGGINALVHAVSGVRQEQLNDLIILGATEDQADGVILPLPLIVASGPVEIQLHLCHVSSRQPAHLKVNIDGAA